MNAIFRSQLRSKLLFIVVFALLICGLLGSGLLALGDSPPNMPDIKEASSQTPAQVMQAYIDALSVKTQESLSTKDFEIKAQVEQAFGSDAWNKASYIAISGDPPIVCEVFELASSGQVIDETEYSNALQAHVDQICKEHNFNPEYLSYTGPNLMKLTPDETVLRNLILQEVSEKSPVRISTKAAAPFQNYLLSFSGQGKSTDGMTENYRIALIQKNGVWQVYALYRDSVSIPDSDK